MHARALPTLGGAMRIGVFSGPFLGAGAAALWGLTGLSPSRPIILACVVVYRVPDLDVTEAHKRAAAQVTTLGALKRYRRTFATLGPGILLPSAIRQTRQVVRSLRVKCSTS
jgi:hypothetical protein